MNYQLKIITILKTSHINASHTQEVVQATIAEGTGLAYNLAENGEYLLTHVASGYCLAWITAPDEQVARLWLEEVAPLTDWTADTASLASDLSTKYKTANPSELIGAALVRANQRAKQKA